MLSLKGKIPISIHPFFWVLAGLIGFLNSRANVYGILLWIFVIFVSVLFHEFGHAITAKLFGLHPKIALIAFGGVTSYESKNIPFWKQFLIVLNGPLFGILLFFISTAILYYNIFANFYIVAFFQITQIVNLFWSIVNLLPVLPLDGGQLLRIALEGFFGVKGFRISLLVGALVASLFAVFFFIRGGFLIGALFFLFAFQSFDSWKKAKYVTSEDRNMKAVSVLQRGEEFLKRGKKEKAVEIFEKIRKIQKKGVIYIAATHYLAVLAYDRGDRDSAYSFLLEIKDNLNDNAKCMFHSLSFLHGNYEATAKLSALVYQIKPSFEVAWDNARAFAVLGHAKEAGGWLQTCSSYENVKINELLEDRSFDKVKKEKDFQSFLS